MAQVQRKSSKPGKKVVWEFPLVRKNWMILGIGAAVVVVGYLLMALSITDDPVKHQEVWNSPLAVSVAPFLLVVGFLVIVPYGFMWRDKTSDELPTD